LLSLIKQEIEEGDAVLKRLELDVRTSTELAQLTQAESEAVTHKLEEALRKQGRRDTWVQFAQGCLFFACGVAASELLENFNLWG